MVPSWFDYIISKTRLFHLCLVHYLTSVLLIQGVGYPLDIVVCSALGADMYDCVYPTRTARFGTALVPEVSLASYYYVLMNFCGH